MNYPAKIINGNRITQGIPPLETRYEITGLEMNYSTNAFDQTYYFQTDLDLLSIAYASGAFSVALNSDKTAPFFSPIHCLNFHPAKTDIFSTPQTGSLEFVSIGVDPALRKNLQDAIGVRDSDVRDLLDIKSETATYLASIVRSFILSGGIGGRIVAESMINIALAEAMHAIKGDRGHTNLGMITAPGIARVKDYIEAHLHEDLSLNTLAGLAAMSPYHFARRFKETVGTAPHTYVMQRRSERAVQLLTGTHAPIARIAYDCGFASQSHMTTVVKRFTGTTPAKIRGR